MKAKRIKLMKKLQEEHKESVKSFWGKMQRKMNGVDEISELRVDEISELPREFYWFSYTELLTLTNNFFDKLKKK